jgi:oxygen-dependent protoporphyrinogen oxidase
MTAAIIGGGIAGLTAAYELVKAGERPYLIEPAALGGMIRSELRDGFTLEQGPNVLVMRPDLRDILREIGLEGQAVSPCVPSYGQYVWYRGRPQKVPQSPLKIIGTPLFDPLSKLGLLAKVLMPGVLPHEKPDYSVRQFFTPVIGARAVQALLDPVLKGIYGGDISALSARTLFPGLWNAAKQRSSLVQYMRSKREGRPAVVVIKGGIQSLPDTLWKIVEPHVNLVRARVERIIPSDDRKRFKLLLSGATHLEVDGCLITTAGKHTAPLVSYLSEPLCDQLVHVKAASLTVIHLAVPRSAPLIPGAFGVLFPGGMPENLLGVMFNSQLFPHVAPPDSHVLTVIVGGAQAGDDLPNEVILRMRIPQLLAEFLGLGSARWLGICHWQGVIPQLAVGHYKIVEALDACEDACKGIVFAGVDRGGVGVSDRIRIAREAVRRFRRVRVETVS